MNNRHYWAVRKFVIISKKLHWMINDDISWVSRHCRKLFLNVLGKGNIQYFFKNMIIIIWRMVIWYKNIICIPNQTRFQKRNTRRVFWFSFCITFSFLLFSWLNLTKKSKVGYLGPSISSMTGLSTVYRGPTMAQVRFWPVTTLGSTIS